MYKSVLAGLFALTVSANAAFTAPLNVPHFETAVHHAAVPVAVFGSDDRMPLPARLKPLERKIGILYEPRTRSVCTAFCVGPSTIATAAHCLYRTRGEAALPLKRFTFRLAAEMRRAGTPLAGVKSNAVDQHVLAGSRNLSTAPPIDASRDWALVRLAAPTCQAGALPLSERTPEDLSQPEAGRTTYQVGFHGDFGNWRLAFSPPCGIQQVDAAKHDSAAGDFTAPSGLLLHTCDTGGASSGSPLLVDGPHGPEVVGINVGTYLRSRILTQAGQVLHRYKADAVANTAVSTHVFKDHLPGFTTAAILTSRAGIARLQRALTQAGYYRGPLDSRFNADLRTAIESFERASGRPSTGLATPDLLRRAEAVAGGDGFGPGLAAGDDRIETGSVRQPARASR